MVPVDELNGVRPRRRLRRVLLTLVPALAFLALLVFGVLKSSPSETGAGATAPEFELPALAGGRVVRSEDLRGRPVVVNFWASWCVPCREEAPLLQRAWQTYRSRGVVFLGVNIRDSQPDARRFVEEFGITYPVVQDVRSELSKKLKVTGLPETFFIDHEWRFVASASGRARGEREGTVVLGAISEEQLTSNVEILIRRAGAREKREENAGG